MIHKILKLIVSFSFVLNRALNNLKKSQQAERASGVQMTEEARRKEEEAKREASKAQV